MYSATLSKRCCRGIEHTKKVGVYGTLRRGHGNHTLLGGMQFVEEIEVDGLTMYVPRSPITGQPSPGIPFVDVGERDDKIIVEVYDGSHLSHADWHTTMLSLDGLEGHPRWYKRSLIDVGVGDNLLEEMRMYLYTMPDRAEHLIRLPGGDFSNLCESARRRS